MKGVRQVNRAAAALLLMVASLMLVAACSSGAAPPPPVNPGNGLSGVAGPGNDSGKPADDQNGNGGTSQDPAASPGTGDAQQIVYTGTLDLQVGTVSSAIDQANQLIAGLGGHVASSNATSKDDQDYAKVTYRIPADKWDEALAGLRGVGTKVLNETTSSEDVTGKVVDLDARIANAQASEAALQAIMAKATTIDDVLKVQNQLTQVQGDIESMTAQRNLLANQAAEATLEVDFETVVTQTQTVSGGWDFGQVLDDALAALVRVGQGVVTLGVWLVVVVLPIALPLLLILGLGVYLRRRWLRNHPPADVAVPPSGASAM